MSTAKKPSIQTLVMAMFMLLSVFTAQATTYYSKATGAANTFATWGTNSDGTGTAPTNFTTPGNIFILRSASALTLSASWTIGSGVILDVQGTLTLTRNNQYTITISGTIDFKGTATTQLGIENGAGNANHTFVLSSGSTLKTANTNGITAVTNASIQTNPGKLTVTLPSDANYQFTGGNQTTNGLPGTVNGLTFDGTGTKTLASALTSITTDLTLSGTVTVALTGNLSVGRHITIGTGTTYNASTHQLSVGGNFTNNGTFTAGTSTVLFNGTTARQIITGTTTFHNLTINNTFPDTGGVKSDSDITVNGVLNLQAANPNATDGSLDMVVEYGDYSNILTATENLTTTKTQAHDILNSKILYMGATATTIGPGDVTGKVKRNTIAANTEYTFGSQHSSISFTPPLVGNGNELPSAIMFVITKGSDRGIHANKTNTVQRLYQIIRTGGAGTFFSVKLRYLDLELNGNTENSLVLWDHHIPYTSTNTPHEHGKTAQNTTDNWVSLSGHAITYLGTQEEIGGFTKYWMFSNTLLTGNNWLGADPGGYTDWTRNSNWTRGWVPKDTDNVIIPVTANYPVLPEGAVAKTITIEPGATLNGGTGTLTLKGGIKDNGGTGSWNNFGTFNQGTSTVIFDYPRGTNGETSTISGTGNFHNVSVTTGTFLVMQGGSTMSIAGAITNNGTLDCSTNSNTVVYNGTGAQTIINPNGGNTGYHHLTLSSGGALTWPESNNMKIAGNLTNNISGLTIPGTIQLTGNTTTQVLGGDHPTTFDNLLINNTAGASLTKSQTVTGTLTLTSGVITTGSETLTLGEAGTITGGSASSHISGKLARVYSAAGSKSFPVGKGGNYRPLSVNFTSRTCTGNNTVTAEQFEAELPGTLPVATDLFRDRYWNITEAGCDGTFAYTVTLDGTGFSPSRAETAVMLKENEATVDKYAVSKSDNQYTNTTAFTSFSNFGLGERYVEWAGVTPFDWDTSSNWNPVGVPTSTDNVIIGASGSPVIANGTNATTYNLTISTGGSVSIAPGGSLDVKGDLNNTGTLQIGSSETLSGSLIIDGTSTGNITYNRWMKGGRWYVVSSPVSIPGTIGAWLPGKDIPEKSGSYGMTIYNEAAGVWGTYYTTSTSLAFELARGYLLRKTSDGTIPFTGTYHAGNITIPLNREANGWNSVGNPYTSSIRLTEEEGKNSFFSTANVESMDPSFTAVYIWDESTGYASARYNTVSKAPFSNYDYIQTGQGFLVKARTGASSLTFTPDMQYIEPAVTLKSATTLNKWYKLELRVSSGTKTRTTSIAFRNDMTHGLDRSYDAGILKNDPDFEIFTRLVQDNGVDFTIQCLPTHFLETVTIPIGIDLPKGGEISFRTGILDLPEGYHPVLRDFVNNTSTPLLSANDSYTVILPAGTKGTGRFYLVFECENIATWYKDSDGDGYGDPGTFMEACDRPDGFVENNLDPDDNNPNIIPVSNEPEQLTYIGDYLVPVAGDNARLILAARVTKKGGSVDGMKIRFVDRNTNNYLTGWLNVIPDEGSDSQEGTVSSLVNISIHPADGGKLILTGMQLASASGEILPDQPQSDVVIALARNKNNFVSGAGSILLRNPSGILNPGQGTLHHFGFYAAAGAGKNAPKGSVMLTIQNNQQENPARWLVNTTSLSVLTIRKASSVEPASAILSGNAIIKDITNGNPGILVESKATIHIAMTDLSAGGLYDLLSVTVKDSRGNTWFVSCITSAGPVEQQLANGNIQINLLNNSTAMHPVTVQLSSGKPNSTTGERVTFTAMLNETNKANNPTGYVAFLQGNVLIGYAPVNKSGVATISTSLLQAGEHAIQAWYPGDIRFMEAAGTFIQSVSQNALASQNIQKLKNATIEHDQTREIRLKVYPNPAQEKVYIRTEGFNQDILVQMFNANGSLVRHATYPAQEDIPGMHEWEVKDLVRGFFLIRVTDQMGNSETRRVILGN